MADGTCSPQASSAPSRFSWYGPAPLVSAFDLSLIRVRARAVLAGCVDWSVQLATVEQLHILHWRLSKLIPHDTCLLRTSLQGKSPELQRPKRSLSPGYLLRLRSGGNACNRPLRQRLPLVQHGEPVVEGRHLLHTGTQTTGSVRHTS